MLQAQLIGIAPEQGSLPGIKPPLGGPHQPPLLVAVRDDEIEVSPAQLTFGPNQMPLEAVDPQPQQMSLLPDPPPWESADDPLPPPPASGRLSKKRSRSGIGRGQGTLF